MTINECLHYQCVFLFCVGNCHLETFFGSTNDHKWKSKVVSTCETVMGFCPKPCTDNIILGTFADYGTLWNGFPTKANAKKVANGYEEWSLTTGTDAVVADTDTFLWFSVHKIVHAILWPWCRQINPLSPSFFVHQNVKLCICVSVWNSWQFSVSKTKKWCTFLRLNAMRLR